MKREHPGAPRRVGRPLSFDRDEALGLAMMLFWQHGYEATTLADLTKAMGVTPPSIYAAFGDKKGLFRAAVRRYVGEPVTSLALIAQAPTAEAAARSLVEGAVVAFTGNNTPAGCLLASGAIAVSRDADDLREELAELRRGVEMALRDKIAADIAVGVLPATTDPDLLAAYTMTLIQGFATLARDGATRPKLGRIAEAALATWTTMASGEPERPR